MQRVRSKIERKDMRNVLCQMSADATRRIFKADSCEKRVKEGYARCNEDREDAVSVTTKHKFFGGNLHVKKV